MNPLLQFAYICGFGTACWALGDILRRCFFDHPLPIVGRHMLSFTAGNVGFSYLLTALGFSGLYVPWMLKIVFFGGIGLLCLKIIKEGKSLSSGHTSEPLNHIRGLQDLIDIQRRGNEPEGELALSFENEVPRNKKESIALLFLVLVVMLFLIPSILQAAAPPYARDSLVYHLLCPREYLKAERLVHIEGNLYSAFPKGHEVLMTLLLSNAGERAAQGFSILQQIAAIGGLYSLTCMMAGFWPAALCTVGYATVPPVLYFTGCGYVEPALLMTLGGCLLLLAVLMHSEKIGSQAGHGRLGPFALLGFVAGWMPALKYTGLVYLGLIGLILLWSQRRENPNKVLRIIGVFSFSAAPGLCWMGWNWIVLGNPVYPMAWFLFGGKGWDETRAVAMSQYFDVYGMGKNLLDYLLLSWRLAFSGRFDTIRFDGAIGPFFILAFILAVVSTILIVRRRLTGSILKGIGLMFVVSAAFFLFGTQQVRFWLPSQMLVCIFAAPSVGLLVNWTRKRPMIRTMLVVILMGSLAWNIWFFGHQFLKIGFYRPVLGMEQERDFLFRNVPGYPALEFINQNLPPRSRLLCVWTGSYGYYLNRKYYSDTFIEDIFLKKSIRESTDGRGLSQKLSQAGFTHLFLNVSILERNLGQGERAIWGHFLRKESLQLFQCQNYWVLKVCRE